MLALLLGLTMLVSVGLPAVGTPQIKYEEEVQSTAVAVAEDTAPQERILTQYAMGVRADNRSVYAFAKNVFTLFPSVVPVRIDLYRSATFTENLDEMNIVATNFTSDLNMGEELTCKFGNVGRVYWRAKLTYWDSSGMPQSIESGTIRFDEAGHEIV